MKSPFFRSPATSNPIPPHLKAIIVSLLLLIVYASSFVPITPHRFSRKNPSFTMVKRKYSDNNEFDGLSKLTTIVADTGDIEAIKKYEVRRMTMVMVIWTTRRIGL